MFYTVTTRNDIYLLKIKYLKRFLIRFFLSFYEQWQLSLVDSIKVDVKHSVRFPGLCN